MVCTLLNVFIQTLLTRNVGIASVAYGLDPRSSRFCRQLGRGFYEFLPFIPCQSSHAGQHLRIRYLRVKVYPLLDMSFRSSYLFISPAHRMWETGNRTIFRLRRALEVHF